MSQPNPSTPPDPFTKLIEIFDSAAPLHDNPEFQAAVAAVRARREARDTVRALVQQFGAVFVYQCLDQLQREHRR